MYGLNDMIGLDDMFDKIRLVCYCGSLWIRDMVFVSEKLLKQFKQNFVLYFAQEDRMKISR